VSTSLAVPLASLHGLLTTTTLALATLLGLHLTTTTTMPPATLHAFLSTPPGVTDTQMVTSPATTDLDHTITTAERGTF
jgi:hypothetical protein